jgi:hypothetical protein
VISILKAVAGRRVCPWCEAKPATLYDSVYDRLPTRLNIWLWPYDRLVGRVGIRIHSRHQTGRLKNDI